jgi:hypothetical protein
MPQVLRGGWLRQVDRGGRRPRRADQVGGTAATAAAPAAAAPAPGPQAAERVAAADARRFYASDDELHRLFKSVNGLVFAVSAP